MNRSISNEGTTFVELLISLALVSIVTSGFMAVYWSGNSFFAKQTASGDIQYMARIAMQWIVADVKEASEIIAKENKLIITTTENKEVFYRLDEKNQLLRNSVPIAENIINIRFHENSELIEIIIEAAANGEEFTLFSSSSPRIQKN